MSQERGSSPTQLPKCAVCRLTKSRYLINSRLVISISVQLFLQRSLKDMKTRVWKEVFVLQGYALCLAKFKLSCALNANIQTKPRAECKHVLYSHLANQKVCVIKMPAVHFGRLSRRGLDLHAHLHAFTSFSERLVVGFNASNNSDIQKLQNEDIFNFNPKSFG